ncbi:nuclear transport factor 2 family protein [Nocardioides albidus]|uniref:Nuclear transport factor 2 family protein n=1 Tax=Nocardioides albidus TaxID=1517589 RepID=A0A5C4VPR6_9ACTN|nr:nuclear transport factor 2 family protein [Nocardioides albidus]TNM37485.1 nuclear transport factor 2 family protein [Nocardioides albidus]
MSTDETIAALVRRVDALEAEGHVRRLQARYMLLCDTPLPEYGVADDAKRIELILELYAEDAVWEGVGDYYDGQFGRMVGKDRIREHFTRFWGEKRDPALVLNAHYLTSEHIQVDGDTAEGLWIHMQPWLYADGTALLRSSRLNNAFRKEPDGTWRITRTRTENVFVAPLPRGFASDHATTSVLLGP